LILVISKYVLVCCDTMYELSIEAHRLATIGDLNWRLE